MVESDGAEATVRDDSHLVLVVAYSQFGDRLEEMRSRGQCEGGEAPAGCCLIDFTLPGNQSTVVLAVLK